MELSYLQKKNSWSKRESLAKVGLLLKFIGVDVGRLSNSKRISIVGLTGGVLSIFLWINFTFLNPYSNPTMGPMLNTFLMLFLPACLAIFSSIKPSQKYMFIAFLWSIPMNLSTSCIIINYGLQEVALFWR